MMMTMKYALLTMVTVPSAGFAQSMNAEVFHKRSSALMAKGPAAIFSRSEIKALLREVEHAGKAARERRLADVAGRRLPRTCPPTKSTMGSGEFMKRLGAIPTAERLRIDMTEAMIRISAARFPCPR